MNKIYLKLWEFIRDDLTVNEFENSVYTDELLPYFFPDDLYFEIITNDFKNKDTTFCLKEKLKLFLREKFPVSCKCIELSNLAVVGMGEEGDNILKSVHKVIDRGEPFWWLYLSKCKECNQYWLIAQEERINDIYCLYRQDKKNANEIINNKIWPVIFDRYEQLLKIGKDAGISFRFVDPINSYSINATVEVLAKEKPGIKISYLAELLNVDVATAGMVAKNIVEKTGVNIDLNN